MTDKLKALAQECIERGCEWEDVLPNFGSTSGDRLMREYINEVVPVKVLELIAENEALKATAAKTDDAVTWATEKVEQIIAERDALRTQVAELSKDAVRLVWAMNHMGTADTHITYSSYVLAVGGTGDIHDCRTYIDAQKGN